MQLTQNDFQSICISLVTLTPLVMALSKWHIALRKNPKKPAAAASTTNASSSLTPGGSREKRSILSQALRGSLCGTVVAIGYVLMLVGLSLFGEASKATNPLTPSDVVNLVFASFCAMIGWRLCGDGWSLLFES